MRRIVVISIVALLMGSVAFAQSVESANGYDWRSFTPSQQHAQLWSVRSMRERIVLLQ
mgnify:CR=1 FL=1